MPNILSALLVPAFTALDTRLTGNLCLPGDAAYDRLATPWNVAAQPTPAAVVEARNAHDIVEAVRFAGAAGLPVAVQATGHGIAGDLDGALLVHTGRLDECVVHPDGWARVGAGVRWQLVIDRAAVHGLAPLAGSSPNVGVVGYTTGGGLGPLARTYGLASDLVRAIELVTGDGVLRRVTAQDEPDLFWGVRGGKGALGIVTAMEFDLVRHREIYGGAVYFDATDTPTVLHAWADWSADLPEEANTSVALLRLPPLPDVPEPLAGRPTLAVRFTWTGDPTEGEEVFAPVRRAGTALIDTVGPMSFTDIGEVHADPVDPMPVHEAADLLDALPEDAVARLLDVAGPSTDSPQVIVELRRLGGAVGREPRVPSAVCHRDAAYALTVIGVLAPPIAQSVVAHARAVREAMSPWARDAVLPNFEPGTGRDRISRSYDASTVERLLALAERYDPDHVLRAGQVPVRTTIEEENR